MLKNDGSFYAQASSSKTHSIVIATDSQDYKIRSRQTDETFNVDYLFCIHYCKLMTKVCDSCKAFHLLEEAAFDIAKSTI